MEIPQDSVGAEVVRCWRVALASAGFKTSRGNPGVWSFLHRRANLANNGGLPQIKKDLSYLRVHLINGTAPLDLMRQCIPKHLWNASRDKLIQVTMVHRALPLPDQKKVNAALVGLKANVTMPLEESDLSKAILSDLRSYLLMKVDSEEILPKSKAPLALEGGSACLECSRAQGGYFGRSLELLQPREKEKLKDGEGIRRTRQSVSNMIALPDPIPPSPVLVIKEQGFKARVVQKSAHAVVALGHEVRRRLWPCLTGANFVTSQGLKDPEMSEIVFRKAKVNSRIYSADFSAATDLLSFGPLDVVADVLGEDPRVLYKGHSLLIDGEVVVPVRGSFMGLPASWAVLSLTHFIIARRVDPSLSFRIKGDDLIACWDDDQIRSFVEQAGSLGLVVNDKTSISNDRGIFCEKVYSREYRGTSTVLKKLPIIGIRSYLRPLDQSGAISLPGSEFASSALKSGYPRKTLVHLQRLCFSKICKEAALYGVNPYLPEFAGGLGLAPSRPLKKVPEADAFVYSELHNGGLLKPLKDVKMDGELLREVTKIADRVRYVRDLPGVVSDPGWDSEYAKVRSYYTWYDSARLGKAPVVRPESLQLKLRRLSHIRRKSQGRKAEHLSFLAKGTGITYSSFWEIGPLVPLSKSVARVKEDLSFCASAVQSASWSKTAGVRTDQPEVSSIKKLPKSNLGSLLLGNSRLSHRLD